MKTGFARKGAGWRYIQSRAPGGFLAHAGRRKALVSSLADRVFRPSVSPEYPVKPFAPVPDGLLPLVDDIAHRLVRMIDVEPKDPAEGHLYQLLVGLLFELGYPHLLRRKDPSGDASLDYDVRVLEACLDAGVIGLTTPDLVALLTDNAAPLYRHLFNLAAVPVHRQAMATWNDR